MEASIPEHTVQCSVLLASIFRNLNGDRILFRILICTWWCI